MLELPTLDLLQVVQEALGHQLSLDHLARETLGVRGKSGDGLQALDWYRRGQWRRLERYCLEAQPRHVGLRRPQSEPAGAPR